MKNEILKYYFLSNKRVKCRAERKKTHVSAETTKTISLWRLQIGILLLTTLYPWSSNNPPPPTTWPLSKNTYKIMIVNVLFNSVLKLKRFILLPRITNNFHQAHVWSLDSTLPRNHKKPCLITALWNWQVFHRPLVVHYNYDRSDIVT